MSLLRIAVAALGLALGAAIAWASFTGEIHGGFFDQGGVLVTLPWGIVTLVDLYVGFVFMAIIMVLAERNFIVGLIWALPLFVLGNIWAAIWLLLRLPSLARRLTRPDEPA